MTDILSAPSRAVLARYAASKLLVAFDYDGTLAPIVTRPDRARMRATTRRLLRRVATRYPCVVISGRPRADVIRRLRHIPVVHVSGNHGIEPWAEQAGYAALVRGWAVRVGPRLASVPGVFVEDKVYSLSIHYRAAHDKCAAREAIEAAVADLRGARRVGGKQVLNLLPRGAPSKGAALERARRVLGCDTALYVGDDETDEEVFRGVRPGRLLSVRVGPVEQSRAPYLLKYQRQIDTLLGRLAALRPESCLRPQ